jgi:hypothetical protein
MKERYGRQYVTAEDIEPFRVRITGADIERFRVRFTGAVMFLDYANKAREARGSRITGRSE